MRKLFAILVLMTLCLPVFGQTTTPTTPQSAAGTTQSQTKKHSRKKRSKKGHQGKPQDKTQTASPGK